MNHEVRRRLEDAGRQPVPPPDPGFADALEGRLFAVATTAPIPPTPPRRPRRSLRAGLVAGAATLAVAGLVVALVVANVRPPVDDTRLVALELVAPVNVEVALADGTTLEDPDGLYLPEGAVIVVGDGGSARVGDTVLRPGDIATIERGGGVRIEHRGAVASVTTTPRPTARPTPRRTPAPSRAPTPRPAATAAPTKAPATPAPTAIRTARPTKAPTPEPTDVPVVVVPTATSTPAPAPAVVRPRLRARLIDQRRIAVSWTATHRADSYVLIVTAAASSPAPDPVYPGSRVVGTFAHPPERPLRFWVRAGTHEVKIRVIALRANGSVLRRSNIVTITVPVDVQGSGEPPRATGTPAPTPTPTPTGAP